MGAVIFRVGDILQIDNLEYAVIFIKNDEIIMVSKDSMSIELSVKMFSEIEDLINEGLAIQKPPEYFPYVNLKTLSKSKLEAYNNKIKFINDVNNIFGPTFLNIKSKDNKEIFDNCDEKYHLSYRTCWNVLRKYLQSGLNPNSLIDKRNGNINCERSYKVKTGRPSNSILQSGIILTPEVKEYFNEAIKDFLSGRARSRKDAFDVMLIKHFSFVKSDGSEIKKELLPPNKRPTLYQFYNYCRTKIQKDELSIAKTSKQEYRNKERLLLSDSLIDADHPMSLCEIDECEADIFLVSEQDASLVVGRPIIYVMIDVYSKMIIAVSVSFENNSIRGFTNCMLNLLDDKVKLCSEYGIVTSKDIWVDHYLPQRIRCDYGSEYISKEVQRICNELNIQKENVPPGTGSLKGIVEQSFHQFNSKTNWVIENNGLIEKRHDSSHKKKARLNIEEFKSMVYAAVIAHNSRYNKNYPLSRGMIKDKVKPLPSEVWKYGVENYGQPKTILNDNNFRYSLLENVKATISRDGVTFKKLKYINTEDEFILGSMIKAGAKRTTFNCRIDSRCINNLYCLDNGVIHVLHLNELKTGMDSFKSLSLYEYERLYKQKLETDKLGDEYNQRIDVELKQKQMQIIKESDKNTKVSSKNLRENRKIEKLSNGKENQIMKDFEDKTIETVSNIKQLETKAEHEEGEYSSLISKLENLE